MRVGDIDGDGRLHVVTGWEEGGIVRVYLHPGVESVRLARPSVTVGQVGTPEDAVFVDLEVTWEHHEIETPSNAGPAKAVAVADVDLDRRSDILFATEAVIGDLEGLIWLGYATSAAEARWRDHPSAARRGQAREHRACRSRRGRRSRPHHHRA